MACVSSFVDWALENGWKKGLSLDRINNDGNYSPDNCRWADAKMQARNKSTCVCFEHNGETKCMIEWCEHFGMPHYLACERHNRGAKEFETIFYKGNLRERGVEKL